MKSLVFLPILLFSACKAQENEPKKRAEEKAPAQVEKSTTVLMKTSEGDITIELNGEKAPITVANFLKYVDASFYDNLVFHRVMDGFMIQGGGFELKDDIPTEKKNNPPIKNEGQNGLKNDRGTIAMARTNVLDSATSQFFINVVDNAGLNYPSNGGYAVFGKVTQGMDIVDKIKKVEVGVKFMNSRLPNGDLRPGRHQNVPKKPVIIKSIRRVANK
ncbi:MAG: peptidylprolyl isomerase [Akkermansiaceae bacterium]